MMFETATIFPDSFHCNKIDQVLFIFRGKGIYDTVYGSQMNLA
jgi:hypothetical protein